MTKVAAVIFCRDKEKFVQRAVESTLNQTHPNLEIILSDQGSMDKSYEIMELCATAYKGPHNVRLMRCPDTDPKGMAGLNAHINWVHEQTDAELIVTCSADDYNEPERVENIIAAYESNNKPDWVGTCVLFENPQGEVRGVTGYSTSLQYGEGAFIGPIDMLKGTWGGSSSAAWRREFMQKYKPVGSESIDVIHSFLATLGRGFYYINKPLHHYVEHGDVNNTGTEGIMRAATTDEEKLQALETMNYHFASNMHALIRKIQEHKIELAPDVEALLLQNTLQCGAYWAMARDKMTLERIQPKGMRG